jgi:hypothetical protein
VAADSICHAKITRMTPSNRLPKELILVALTRYYKESLLPPRVRFYIEELVAELNPENDS